MILNNPTSFSPLFPLVVHSHFTDVVVEHLLGFILWKLIIVCENYRFRKISLIMHNTHTAEHKTYCISNITWKHIDFNKNDFQPHASCFLNYQARQLAKERKAKVFHVSFSYMVFNVVDGKFMGKFVLK